MCGRNRPRISKNAIAAANLQGASVIHRTPFLFVIETPKVVKVAPLPLRLRFAHHNHDGKLDAVEWPHTGLAVVGYKVL